MKKNTNKVLETLLSEIKSGEHKNLVKHQGATEKLEEGILDSLRGNPMAGAAKIRKDPLKYLPKVVEKRSKEGEFGFISGRTGKAKEALASAFSAQLAAGMEQPGKKVTMDDVAKKKSESDMEVEKISAMNSGLKNPLKEAPEVSEPIVYGIPDSNKYPLDTPQRVIFAIRIFNTIREEFHQQFAEAIVTQAKKLGIDLSLVPETSALFKYLPRADKAESRQSDQHIPVANPKAPVQTQDQPLTVQAESVLNMVELSQLFEELRLDTEKYTAEYLVEALGFTPLYSLEEDMKGNIQKGLATTALIGALASPAMGIANYSNEYGQFKAADAAHQEVLSDEEFQELTGNSHIGDIDRKMRWAGYKRSEEPMLVSPNQPEYQQIQAANSGYDPETGVSKGGDTHYVNVPVYDANGNLLSHGQGYLKYHVYDIFPASGDKGITDTDGDMIPDTINPVTTITRDTSRSKRSYEQLQKQLDGINALSSRARAKAKQEMDLRNRTQKEKNELQSASDALLLSMGAAPVLAAGAKWLWDDSSKKWVIFDPSRGKMPVSNPTVKPKPAPAAPTAPISPQSKTKATQASPRTKVSVPVKKKVKRKP
jgi:hypothetical protein